MAKRGPGLRAGWSTWVLGFGVLGLGFSVACGGGPRRVGGGGPTAGAAGALTSGAGANAAGASAAGANSANSANSMGGGSAGGSTASGGEGEGGAVTSGGAPTNVDGGTAGVADGGAAPSDAGGPSMDMDPELPPLPEYGPCQITARCTEEISDEPKVQCAFDVVGASDAVSYVGYAGMEIRGRSSQNFPKQNYAIELWTEDGQNNPADLLGMGGESDWVLDGAWADRSFFRNALVFDLFRGLSERHYAAESSYCTLTLNDDPQGIYRLVEKIKKDSGRVVLTDDDGTGASFVIKQDDDGSLWLPLGYDEAWEMVYPNQDTATEAQLGGVQTWLDGLAAALDDGAASDLETGIFAFLDPEVARDWMLVEEFSKNVDAYGLSLFLARDAGGRARLMPWDIDLGFGQPTVNDEELNEGEPGDAGAPPVPGPPPNESPENWIRNRTALPDALLAVPAFRESLAPRWAELRAGAWSNEAVNRLLDDYAARLEPADLDENFSIWPIADVDFERIYTPYSFYDVSSYAEEVTAIRTWIAARLAWMDAHIGELGP